MTCNNLGAVAATHGDGEEAERRYRQALRLKEALLGPDHPDVAVTLHNLGVLRNSQGADDEAVALLQRALGILAASFEAGHPKIAACTDALASVSGGGRSVPG